MKVILAAVNAKYIHSNLAVYCLKAYANKKGYPVDMKEYTINQSVFSILKSLYQAQPDLLVFSCYIWNISMVKELAAEFHRICPRVPIWVGGPEVSFDAGDFLKANPWASGVMRGEGEETFAELLKIMDENGSLSDINGISFCSPEGEILENPDRAVMDLSDVPFPYKDLSDFDHRIIYYESSRGCPFSCSYCLSSVDKKLRFRDLGLVFKELDFFLQARVSQVKFVDRTFNCKPARAREIWTYITEHDNGVTNFHFEVAADLLEDGDIALINAMRPGLIQLEIGVQSTNEKTICEIRRKMDLDILTRRVAQVKSGKNVHQHLDLIAGLPYEDIESFKKSFNDIYAMEPDQLQLGFLKVLKGSYMYHMAEKYDCLYTAREPYEVLSTAWLGFDDLLRLKRVEEMVEVYYNSGQFTYTLPACIEAFPDPFSFFDSLGSYYEEQGYLDISHTRIRRYQILRDFMAGQPGQEEQAALYDEWMIFDLYLRENMKTRPAWGRDLSPYKEKFRSFYQKEEEEHSFLPELSGRDSRQMAKMTHIEVFFHIFDEEKAVLFSYEEREPLHHSARWQILKPDLA